MPRATNKLAGISALITAVDASTPAPTVKAPAPITMKADKAADVQVHSAFAFKNYTPELKALVKEIALNANAATSAGLKVATSLAEAFKLTPWTLTGHKDAQTWAFALLTEACPLSATSTRYAWIEAGAARAAILGNPGIAGDISKFPMDTLRVIGAKSNTGNNPASMVKLATELLENKETHNTKGSVDPVKANKVVRGENANAKPTRDEMVATLCVMARKYSPDNAQGALDLLNEAVKRQTVLVNGVVQSDAKKAPKKKK